MIRVNQLQSWIIILSLCVWSTNLAPGCHGLKPKAYASHGRGVQSTISKEHFTFPDSKKVEGLNTGSMGHPYDCVSMCNNDKCRKKFQWDCKHCHQPHNYSFDGIRQSRRKKSYSAKQDYLKYENNPQSIVFYTEFTQLFQGEFMCVGQAHVLPNPSQILKAIQAITDRDLLNDISKALWIDLKDLTKNWFRKYGHYRRIKYKLTHPANGIYPPVDLQMHCKIAVEHMWCITKDQTSQNNHNYDELWGDLFGEYRAILSLSRLNPGLQARLAEYRNNPALEYLLSLGSISSFST